MGPGKCEYFVLHSPGAKVGFIRVKGPLRCFEAYPHDFRSEGDGGQHVGEGLWPVRKTAAIGDTSGRVQPVQSFLDAL